VCLPSGPETLAISSPTCRSDSSAVVLPTRCQIRRIVPFPASASAMVSGIRSAYSLFMLIMTNCPGLLACAISGASTSAVKTSCESCFLLTILCGIFLYHIDRGENPAWNAGLTLFSPATWPTPPKRLRRLDGQGLPPAQVRGLIASGFQFLGFLHVRRDRLPAFRRQLGDRNRRRLGSGKNGLLHNLFRGLIGQRP